MSYHHSDPSREHGKYALPDVEVFYAEQGEWWYDLNGERCDEPSYFCPSCEGDMVYDKEKEDFFCPDCNRPAECGEEPCAAGWYYWFCFPGCLPHSEPFGPFDTEDEALQACRDQFGD